MIPVGTLCEVVGVMDPGCEWVRGRFVTVSGHWLDESEYFRSFNEIDVPGYTPATPADEIVAPDECLRPIVPPGDPDKVDEREPVEAFR